MKKERIGLCSNYLANLPVNSCVKLFAEQGSFKFPTDRPIIMVGKCCVNQPILTVYYKCFWFLYSFPDGKHEFLNCCKHTTCIIIYYKHASLQTFIPFTDRSRYRMCSFSFTDPVPRQNITTTHPVLRVSE